VATGSGNVSPVRGSEGTAPRGLDVNVEHDVNVFAWADSRAGPVRSGQVYVLGP
jgi:hypothetical protein